MIQLNVKTGYSFLKAYGSPEQVLSRADELGCSHICIADDSSTWAHVPFWKEAKKHKVSLLYGVQLNVIPTLDKSTNFDTVLLIAKNQKGLQEQYETLSLATEQFYYRPRVTWDQLATISHNIVVVTSITPATEGFLSVLGAFYLGLGTDGGYISRIVRGGHYRVLLAPLVSFPRVRDEETFRLVSAVAIARKTGDISKSSNWMLSTDEVITKLEELGFGEGYSRGLIDETADVVKNIKCSPKMGTNVKPKTNKTIEQWCEEGAINRGIDLNKSPYKERYEREIAMVKEKGFEDYFLLIADLVDWSKKHMFVGPARGSSAGSLVCYLSGIVEVDPIRFNLLFERFIDVTRKDLPDIDIDFPDEKRDQIFQYLIGKYGANRVARIGTISMFKPKSALNDVGKCYGIPPWEIKKLTEIMVERSGGDARANMAIEDTIDQFDIGKELVRKYPKVGMATQIEGHPRHTGQHAAGVIVSNDAITKYASVNRRNGEYIAMLDKYSTEEVGLLKIDALGLRTLSVIEDCCAQVGVDPRTLYTIPLDDAAAIRIFAEDKVAGIFQFEGYAVRSLMRQMGVEEFNDLVALTALARPGPLHGGSAMEFINRKTGKTDWEYAIPDLQKHTSHTYGTIVYQEQVMSITRDLGDMSWEDVSELRKAMSRSLGEEFFNTYRTKFLKGTRKRKIDDKAAIKIWDEMCTFGSWAFNLSHAVSYGLVSYWCAYLKSRYPLEFTVAQLRRVSSSDSMMRLLREMINEGVTLVPFDPEISDLSWKIHDGKLYGGFTLIKGVGDKTAQGMIDARSNDPLDWIKSLTPAKRAKILAPNNTELHNINRIHKLWEDIYENWDRYQFFDPIQNKTVTMRRAPQNLEDIKEIRGDYAFIATLKKRNIRDLNETQSLAQRGGRRISEMNLFLNLTMEDDTSSILCSINRRRYETLGKPIMEGKSDGEDFFVRGQIKSDGWRKIDIVNIVRISDVSKTSET